MRSLVWLAILLVSCADGIAAPKPCPTTPVAPKRAPREYRSNWEKIPHQGLPPEFAAGIEGGYPWLYDGSWEIGQVGGQHCFRLVEPNAKLEEPLSFRPFCGNTFGPRGLLPSRYVVQAKGRSLGGARRFNGYGELAIQVYFLDPTHYVEVLQTDQNLRIWLADGAQPGRGEGWYLLANIDHPTALGEWVQFGAMVDIPAKTVTMLLDGNPVGTVQVSFLRPIPHGLTIRATGNREDWAWLRIAEY